MQECTPQATTSPSPDVVSSRARDAVWERVVVNVVFRKADPPGSADRTLLIDGTDARPIAVHVIHDLPHLVVESLFELNDGLWAELASGRHAEANLAASARDSSRRKLGRIVSGAASQTRTEEWLSDGHRRAKVITNAVVNRFGDGPDTAAGVRRRLSRESELDDLLRRVDDATIELAIEGVRSVYARWDATRPGESLRLTWPLPRSFFTR